MSPAQTPADVSSAPTAHTIAIKPARPVELPDGLASVRGGAHVDLLAPGEVTFVLYAPHKPFASLVGDFNRWNTLSHPLKTDGNGVWWTTVPHPGETRYGFYVAIDGASHVWVGDPYAQVVEWQDEAAWARLAPPARPFVWGDHGWRTPALRDLVIYELCVRDFGGMWSENLAHRGAFEDVAARIDYLRELGVNAVELMPIQAFPGDSSWGYNPVFFFAPARCYGTPDDFKRLVDAFHRAGIAVILDVAFNHAWGHHPWYRIYPEMYGGKGEWLHNWNPFFHHTPQAVNGWGGVDWDHFTPQTTRYFQDVVRHWLKEYHVDGFRFDWVCGVDFDHREPKNPGFNPYHGISAIAWAARQAKPDAILIGEFWQLEGAHPDKTAAKLVAETELDAVWNGDFHHTVDGVLNQRWEWEKSDIARAVGGYAAAGFAQASQVINYTCSHDEVRPEHEIQFYTSKWIERPREMSVKNLSLAMARLGLVALFAGAGVPMLYAGQEFGDHSPRTVDFLPLQWRLLNDPAHQAHCAVVSRLIRARRTHPALRSDMIEFAPIDFQSKRLVCFRRRDGAGDAAVVALNVSPRGRRLTLELPAAGRWYDAVADLEHDLAQAAFDVDLPPYGACLFVPVREATPPALHACTPLHNR